LRLPCLGYEIDVVLRFVLGQIGDERVDLRPGVSIGPASALGKDSKPEALQHRVGSPGNLGRVKLRLGAARGFLRLLRQRVRLLLDLVHQSHGNVTSMLVTWEKQLPSRR
jgi:hypothetical protein